MAKHPGITKRPDGKYRARYRDPQGKEHAQHFTRVEDAKQWLRSQETAKDKGEWIDPKLGRTTVDEWAERWYQSTVNLKPKTRRNYRSLLDKHLLPHWGAYRLSAVQPVDVRDWVATLTNSGLSASRTRQAYKVLSAMMRDAVVSGYIGRTPCVGVTLPRMPRTKMLFLTPAEVEGLAEAVDPRYRVLVLTLAYCGLRWGEAAALRRGRCQLLRGRLEVVESLAEVSGELYFGPTKTHTRREVAVPAFLVDELARHLADNVDDDPDALVFTSPDGHPLRSNWRVRFWHPALEAAGLPDGLRIHDLRHTCASLLIHEGANVKAVQTQLGHSSATVTLDTYGHLMPDELDRLADALDRSRSAAVADFLRTSRGPEVISLPRSEAISGL